jgi:hypothetical protein
VVAAWPPLEADRDREYRRLLGPFVNLLAHMKYEDVHQVGLDVHFTVVDKVQDILSTFSPRRN